MPLKNKKPIANALLRHRDKILFLALFCVLTSVMVWSPLGAYGVNAAGLSFGFNGGRNVVNGMIVSISREDVNMVERTHVNNAEYVVGVSVDKESSSVVFDNDDSVYVATEGTIELFVSDIGGDISSGDLISVSSISGVGRKKSNDVPGQKIVAVAKSEFNATTEGAELIDLEHSGEVSVGVIMAEVLINEPSSLAADTDSGIFVRIARSIAGETVPIAQVVIAGAITVVGLFVSGALLFGSIKGSFLSIGRNPLSSKAIYAGMTRASLISLSVMMAGTVAGYMVLIL